MLKMEVNKVRTDRTTAENPMKMIRVLMGHLHLSNYFLLHMQYKMQEVKKNAINRRIPKPKKTNMATSVY